MTLLSILKKLVSFRTLSHDQAANLACLNWFTAQTKKVCPKAFIKKFSINGFPSLWITSRRTKKPRLLLGAHLDVVSASPELFKAKIIRNRLCGRGVLDMKFAAACYLKLLEDFGANFSKYDLGIMLTADEELGGENGTEALIQKGYLGRFVILPDAAENWQIQAKAKAVLHLKVDSRGISADGSRPWQGVNAIDQLSEFLNEAKKFFPKEPCGDKNHWHATLSIGNISGGASVNQVPHRAGAWLDIRAPSSQDLNVIKKKLSDLKRSHQGITFQILREASACQIDKDNFQMKLFRKIAASQGSQTKFSLCHGNSDARFFLVKGIQALIVRPKGGGAHTESEWLDLKDLSKFYLVLRDFAKQISAV